MVGSFQRSGIVVLSHPLREFYEIPSMLSCTNVTIVNVNTPLPTACVCLVCQLWCIHVGIRKKLLALSIQRVAYKVLRPWIPAIIDHLYHVVSNSTGNLRVEWWKSVINHCCNIHEHESVVFPECRHGPLDDERMNPDGTMDYRVWINKCR